MLRKFLILFVFLVNLIYNRVGLAQDVYSIPVYFSQHNFPIINTEIGEKTYPIILSIGISNFLSLHSKVFNQLQGDLGEPIKWIDDQGKLYETKPLILSKIKISGREFLNVNVIEEIEKQSNLNQENQLSPVGEIGTPILEKTNLMLDFPHSKIWMINDIEGLHKAGFNKKKMLIVPFEIWRSGLVLKVDTDLGLMRMFLSTSCSMTLLKSQLLEGKDLHKDRFPYLALANTKFSIEGKDFGPLDLHSFKLSSEWDQIDGILGMDFLSQHTIYIDYKNKELYIGYSLKDVCTPLPVKFSSFEGPIIQAQIGKKICPFIFDTGSAFPFSMYKKTLRDLDKQQVGSLIYSNVLEENFSAKLFSIPEIKIGGLVFNQATILEKRKKFLKNTSFGKKEKSDPKNYIGRPILERINLLLDFPHRKIWQIGSADQLKKIGLDVNKMIQVPFELTKWGMILDVDLDIGKLRLTLDTGSTWTIVKSSILKEFTLNKGKHLFYYLSPKFQIGEKDFGRHRIYSLDIFPFTSEVDGILGMDFLKYQIVYIDYQKRMLYIANPIDRNFFRVFSSFRKGKSL